MVESLDSDQPEVPRGPTPTDAVLARTSTGHRRVGPIAYDCGGSPRHPRAKKEVSRDIN